MLKKILIILCVLSGSFQSRAREASLNLDDILWECEVKDFCEEEYERAVELLVAAYEKESGKALVPGRKKKVGLKVYTHSGLGLSTPKNLVNAVLKMLSRRGFRPEDVFLIDLNDWYLRKARYLPALSKRSLLYKETYSVYSQEGGAYGNLNWHYSSNLPPLYGQLGDAQADERLSYLPYPLLWEVDFWINLPMVVNHDALGVSGALANASVWNMTNSRRFLRSPRHVAEAVAEVAAIPELKRTWVFTIMTLERYQYIGGIKFNSLYTVSENKIWLSSNPVVMDYKMYEKINRKRKAGNFPMIQPIPLSFEYSKQLGLGNYVSKALMIKKLK